MLENFAVAFLRSVYTAKFKKEWVYSQEAPHFYNHRMGMATFVFGDQNIAPFSYYRGFLASQVIKHNDRLLDIGCGDGFFTKRFFAQRCSFVDAIDIEPSAIQTAQKFNRSANISYYILDAVKQPFPRTEYDVIIWDGAIGHFAANTIDIVLEKIRAGLSNNGVFVGSESLGDEGQDHLARFYELADLGKIFTRFFQTVLLYSIEYPIGNNFLRREAYWRCSNGYDRIESADWQEYQGK